jgi:nucleotide sugar dehydrogenase
MINVAVQGLGFVGSAIAVAIASRVRKNKKPIFNVIGIDQDNELGRKRIDLINKGIFPIETSDRKMLALTKRFVKNRNLKASCNPKFYNGAKVIIVSINFDLVRRKKAVSLDMDTFKKSIEEIAENISKETLIIVQSTIPPGTCKKIIRPLLNKILKRRNINPNQIYLAHSYERVMPGENYLNSIINYWRVYSGVNKTSANKCRKFLSQLIDTKKFPLTELENTEASETAKLLENSFRATNIAFIEEWSRFAEDIGIDLYKIIDAIKFRPTHKNIMRPGFGVGGYCLTKDPLIAKIASREIYKTNKHKFEFSSKSIEINNKMPLVSLNKIKQYYGNKIKNKKLLLLGITYREDVGDTRFSPSEIFFKQAEKIKIKVIPFDPLVQFWNEMKMKMPLKIPQLDQFDIIFLAVKHKVFNEINFKKTFNKKKKVLIFDSNEVLNSKQIKDIKKNKSLELITIGRGL